MASSTTRSYRARRSSSWMLGAGGTAAIELLVPLADDAQAEQAELAEHLVVTGRGDHPHAFVDRRPGPLAVPFGHGDLRPHDGQRAAEATVEQGSGEEAGHLDVLAGLHERARPRDRTTPSARARAPA